MILSLHKKRVFKIREEIPTHRREMVFLIARLLSVILVIARGECWNRVWWSSIYLTIQRDVAPIICPAVKTEKHQYCVYITPGFKFQTCYFPKGNPVLRRRRL
jgi:hypothetical protein